MNNAGWYKEITVMSIDLQPIKASLRAEILALRNNLSMEEIQTRSNQIAGALCAMPSYVNASTISCYCAFGTEVHTEDIIRHALAQGKRVALPRVQHSTRQLTLHLISDLQRLIPGSFGIQEPNADEPLISPAEVELFVVPGLVFDATGNRIGYGAGYYDTLLADSPGCRIAPCYAFQILARVPAGMHDMPMDLLVTESGVLDCHRIRTKIGD